MKNRFTILRYFFRKSKNRIVIASIGFIPVLFLIGYFPSRMYFGWSCNPMPISLWSAWSVQVGPDRMPPPALIWGELLSLGTGLRSSSSKGTSQGTKSVIPSLRN